MHYYLCVAFFWGAQIVEENTFVPKAGTLMISFATKLSISWCFETLWFSMSGVTHQMAMCRTSRMRHRLNMAGAQHKSLPITRALTSQRKHTLWRSRCFAHSTRDRFIMAQLIYDRRSIPRSYPFLRRVLASEVSSH